MVIRLFHAKVRSGKQAEFKKLVEVLSLPLIQSRHGMIALYPGQPLGPNADEFVLVTVWKDRAVIADDSWVQSIIPPVALSLLEEWHVAGYKSFGVIEQPLKPLFQTI
jgi:hypothetical protein